MCVVRNINKLLELLGSLLPPQHLWGVPADSFPAYGVCYINQISCREQGSWNEELMDPQSHLSPPFRSFLHRPWVWFRGIQVPGEAKARQVIVECKFRQELVYPTLAHPAQGHLFRLLSCLLIVLQRLCQWLWLLLWLFTGRGWKDHMKNKENTCKIQLSPTSVVKKAIKRL